MQFTMFTSSKLTSPLRPSLSIWSTATLHRSAYTIMQSAYSATYYDRNWLEKIITAQSQPLMGSASCCDPTLIYLINKPDLICTLSLDSLWAWAVIVPCFLEHWDRICLQLSHFSEQQVVGTTAHQVSSELCEGAVLQKADNGAFTAPL